MLEVSNCLAAGDVSKTKTEDLRPCGLKLGPTGLKQVGTKVGPDQLGPPVRVGSTRIDSDRLES